MQRLPPRAGTRVNSKFNFNTMLLAILVGGGGWHLKETIALGRTVESMVAVQKQINAETRREFQTIENRLERLERKP